LQLRGSPVAALRLVAARAYPRALIR
jgi:hypothetical protein